MQYKLRDYQEECVQVGLEVLNDKKGRKAVLIAPTSAGKSLIISEISRRLIDGKVLVLSPNVEILEQNLSKINSFGVFPSVYSASVNKKETDGNLIYGTPKSITYEVFKDLNIKYVIVDEVDHATKPDSEIVKLLKKLKIKSVLGLTGSAIYMETSLEGTVSMIMTEVKGAYFNEICKVISTDFMVENKYWADIQYYDVYDQVKESILTLNKSNTEYTEESQKSFYEECNLKDKVSEFLSRLPKNEDAIVFVPDIKSAEELQEVIPNSVFVHSKMNKKQRKERVEGFKNGTYSVMINVGALLVGFDKENMINLIDCSPSNSVRIYIQKIGRILRKHPDKKLGRIIDYSGNFRKHGHIHDIKYEHIENVGWCLFNKNILLTGIPMNRIGEVTREDLIKNGKPNFEYVFGEHNKGDAKVDFGKFKNKPQTVKYLYYRQRHYLKWLAFSDFQFKDKELERQVKTIWNVPYEQH